MLYVCEQGLLSVLGHIYATFFSSRGMEQFMGRFPEHVNMVKPDDEHTALHIAANNDHLDIVRLLASMVRTSPLKHSTLVHVCSCAPLTLQPVCNNWSFITISTADHLQPKCKKQSEAVDSFALGC